MGVEFELEICKNDLLDIFYSQHNTDIFAHDVNTCCTVDQTGNTVFDVTISETEPAIENK